MYIIRSSAYCKILIGLGPQLNLRISREKNESRGAGRTELVVFQSGCYMEITAAELSFGVVVHLGVSIRGERCRWE